MAAKFPIARDGIPASTQGFDMDAIMKERNTPAIKKRFAKALKRLPKTSDSHPYAEAAKPRGK